MPSHSMTNVFDMQTNASSTPAAAKRSIFSTVSNRSHGGSSEIEPY
jgi:hypothetical protein